MSKYTEPWMGYPILLSTMRFTYSMISGMYSLTRVRTLGGRQPSASMSWKKSAWGGGGGARREVSDLAPWCVGQCMMSYGLRQSHPHTSYLAAWARKMEASVTSPPSCLSRASAT